MIKRAALYARTSGDDRERDSLGAQLDLCRQYAEGKDYRVIAELAEDDRGASGALYDLPALNQALDLAEANKIDVVVAREVDRLARNYKKAAIVEDWLEQRGVRVEFALYDFPDTPEGRIQRGFYALFADYERDKIKERLLRGRNRTIRSGQVLFYGRPPYGYQRDPETGRAVIVEERAEIVRQIFVWYTSGVSSTNIAAKLTEMRITSPMATWEGGRNSKITPDHFWNPVQIVKMIRNETYIGKWSFGEQNIPGIVPSIVDEELFRRAQEQVRINTTGFGKNAAVVWDYLFRGRARCGICGEVVYSLEAGGRKSRHGPGRTKRWYYRCRSSRMAESPDPRFTEPCGLRWFNAKHVDQFVWEFLVEWAAWPPIAQAGKDALGRPAATPDTTALEGRLDYLDRHAAGLSYKLAKLRELWYNDVYTLDELAKEKTELENALAATEEERKTVEDEIRRIMRTDPQRALDQLAGLDRRLEEIESFDERREIVELLDISLILLATESDPRRIVTILVTGYPIGRIRIPTGHELRRKPPVKWEILGPVEQE